MTQHALGLIEVYGIPTAMEVADAMCKSAQVSFVRFENADMGYVTVIVRGPIAEVQTAVSVGLGSIGQVSGGSLLSSRIIPCPAEGLGNGMYPRLTDDFID
jgi:carbon dioxide concentrating mechanism protein CcmK